jgi:TPR repeat protein
LIAYYLQPKPTIEDARKAMAAGSYDYATVEKILRPFADKGNKEAQCLLEAAATQHYDYDSLGHLADLGNAAAQFELGSRDIETGSGTEEDVTLLKRSAEQGVRDANVMLGQYYSWEGAHHDEHESRRYYSLASEQGNNYSQWVIYDWYRKQRQFKEAYYWARVCVEAPTKSRLQLYPESCQEDAQALRLRLSKDDIAREEQAVAAFVHKKKSEVTSFVPCTTS